MKNAALLQTLLRRYPSFYLYDQAQVLDRTRALSEALSGAQLLYSVKTNPCPALLRTIFSQGLGADAASLREVELAAACGLSPRQIYYSAPGKSDPDLAAALPLCTLTADSLGELDRLQALAARQSRSISVGLRLNPDYSFGGGAGGPSKFGVDEDQALAALAEPRRWPNLSIVGLHVHLRSQELQAEVLSGYYRALLDLALRFSARLGRPLEFLNLGSGLGIPYAPGDVPLNVAILGQTVRELRAQLPHTRLLIETGRYLVGPAGVYVTSVMDKKVSHGKTFVILHSTLNGFLRPSLAQLVNSYSPSPNPCEPLFTCPDAFRFLALTDARETETVTLAGDLCTAADVIAKDVTLPRLEVGDGVVITNAGSYAATLSPVLFSSHTPPAQLLLRADGQVLDADL